MKIEDDLLYFIQTIKDLEDILAETGIPLNVRYVILKTIVASYRKHLPPEEIDTADGIADIMLMATEAIKGKR